MQVVPATERCAACPLGLPGCEGYRLPGVLSPRLTLAAHLSISLLTISMSVSALVPRPCSVSSILLPVTGAARPLPPAPDSPAPAPAASSNHVSKALKRSDRYVCR